MNFLSRVKKIGNLLKKKNLPLYYYALDQKAGDLNGDGVGGIWHLVKP